MALALDYNIVPTANRALGASAMKKQEELLTIKKCTVKLDQAGDGTWSCCAVNIPGWIVVGHGPIREAAIADLEIGLTVFEEYLREQGKEFPASLSPA